MCVRACVTVWAGGGWGAGWGGLVFGTVAKKCTIRHRNDDCAVGGTLRSKNYNSYLLIRMFLDFPRNDEHQCPGGPKKTWMHHEAQEAR